MKLTEPQQSMLLRELVAGHGEDFIVLYDGRDDRVAFNLARKGLGRFQDNRMHYTWRKRQGYTNNLYLTEKGREERAKLRDN